MVCYLYFYVLIRIGLEVWGGLSCYIYASSGETFDDAVADVVTKTDGSVVVVANPVAPAVAV